MKARIDCENKTDENGNPAGGTVDGVGLWIAWQNGPLGRGEQRRAPNGAFVETVIQAVVQRLEFYQSSKFSCRENALALTKLQEALHWLEHRTALREAHGVEGTHEAVPVGFAGLVAAAGGAVPDAHQQWYKTRAALQKATAEEEGGE